MRLSIEVVPHMNAREVLTVEEMRYVGQIWRAIRGPMYRRGHEGKISALDAIPHLAASLESLVCQGYGYSDIGMMFGVSASTVRNWLRRCGLRSIFGVSPRRVWSETLHQFVPVSVDQCPTRSISERRRAHSAAMCAKVTPTEWTRRIVVGWKTRAGRLSDRELAARRANSQKRKIGQLAKTHCSHGHLYDEKTTRYRRGARECRTCEALARQRRRNP